MSTNRPTPTGPEIASIPSPLLVVALGSWEQHGPHLPLDTDTRIAQELVTRLVGHFPDAVAGPTITVSSSGEHAGFPGTLSIGGDVVVEVVVELARSALWADGIVIVNGHGGNIGYFDRVRTRLEGEGRRVFFWSPPLVDPRDSHAGYVETSVMLAIDPTSVRVDRIDVGSIRDLGDILDDLRRHGVISVSPSGVLGDPRPSDAELGSRLLADWEHRLVGAVRVWRDSV